MEESVLLGTKPLVDSIRHFIRDPSGVFSVCRSTTSRFPPFAFVELVSPYNKKNITRWLEDINFMFSWQKQYLTRSLRSLVRYCSCHSNIKFISSCHRVISSISFPAVQIYGRSCIYLYSSPSTGICDQLPVGLIAQLVEHCTGITEVVGSNPSQGSIFTGFNSTAA